MCATQPVRLAPEFHERVWGVTDLTPLFPHAAKGGGSKLGEAWFTSQPPLPILVKFLFTSDKLSVQVHPDGEWGGGKTEMWRIIRCEPGATIALGFNEPVTADRLSEAARTGEIKDLLRLIPVSPGETYFIPAGTVHAIGAGITICEIQQNSDITYRLYDYGRPRELHLESGVAATKLEDWRHPGAIRETDLPDGWKRLAACRYFATDALELNGSLSYKPGAAQSELLICLEGSGSLNSEDFAAGDVWLIPAGAGALELSTPSALSLLRTYAPSTDS